MESTRKKTTMPDRSDEEFNQKLAHAEKQRISAWCKNKMKTWEDKRFRDEKIKTTAHNLLPEAAIANRSRRVGHAHTLAAAVLAKATVGWH